MEQDLKVYHYPKKRRIGPNHDGGYVVADGLIYDCFFSFGIGGGVKFEKDFLSKHSVPYFAYDGTVGEDKIKLFQSQGVRVIPKNITVSHNLYEEFNKYEDIFLAMDIEGAEYDWLGKAPLHTIKQMVIEFHCPYEKGKGNILKKITETHYLIHLHANNYAKPSVDKHGYPRVFEATYIRKDDLKLYKNTEPLPSKLDVSCNPRTPEIDLNRTPFVHDKP